MFHGVGKASFSEVEELIKGRYSRILRIYHSRMYIIQVRYRPRIALPGTVKATAIGIQLYRTGIG